MRQLITAQQLAEAQQPQQFVLQYQSSTQVINDAAADHNEKPVRYDYDESSAGYDFDGSCPRKGVLMDNIGPKACAKERAKEFQKNLDPKQPSFVKVMVRTQVRYLLLPPLKFIRSYLPFNNIHVNLVDENATTFPVKFKDSRFSTGWKVFSTSHNLVENDALVFQLVNPTQFNVFIIRWSSSSGLQGGLSIQKSDDLVKKVGPRVYASGEVPRSPKVTVAHFIRTDGTSDLERLLEGIPTLDSEEEVSENQSSCLEVSGRNINWANLGKESFDVAGHDLMKGSKLPKSTWTKYYNLCSDLKACLHQNLACQSNKLNNKLVDGIISETVTIANRIKDSNVSFIMKDSKAWGQSLERLERFGMNVIFLRSKLQKLTNLVSEPEDENCAKKRQKLVAEADRIQEELRKLDEIRELKFQDEINASW